jgi:putative FmdB family regulatory protein
MPIYSYKCNECEHTLDSLQKFNDDPLTECPQCLKQSLSKQLSTGTGFCLMGKDWHRPGMSAGNKT